MLFSHLVNNSSGPSDYRCDETFHVPLLLNFCT